MSLQARIQQVLRQEKEGGGTPAGSTTASFKLPDGLARQYGLDTNPAPVSRPGDPAEQRADAVADRAVSSGRPLPASDSGTPSPAMRERLQPHVGNDLAGVRFHTGDESARAAQAMNARAFTIGNDVHFGQGQYRPGTADGDRLIAHEVGHTGGEGLGRQVYCMHLQVGQLTFDDPSTESEWKQINTALYSLKGQKERLDEMIEISLTLQTALATNDYYVKDESSKGTKEALEKAIKNVNSYIVEVGGAVPDASGKKKEEPIKQTGIVHEKGAFEKVTKAPSTKSTARSQAPASEIFRWLHDNRGFTLPGTGTAGVLDRNETVTLKNTETNDERVCGVHVTFFAPTNDRDVELSAIGNFFKDGVVNTHVTVAYYAPTSPHHANNPRAFKNDGWDLKFPDSKIGNKEQKQIARDLVLALRQAFDQALTECAQALRNP